MDLILLVLKQLTVLTEESDLVGTGQVGTVTLFFPKTLVAKPRVKLEMLPLFFRLPLRLPFRGLLLQQALSELFLLKKE